MDKARPTADLSFMYHVCSGRVLVALKYLYTMYMMYEPLIGTNIH